MAQSDFAASQLATSKMDPESAAVAQSGAVAATSLLVALVCLACKQQEGDIDKDCASQLCSVVQSMAWATV